MTTIKTHPLLSSLARVASTSNVSDLNDLTIKYFIKINASEETFNLMHPPQIFLGIDGTQQQTGTLLTLTLSILLLEQVEKVMKKLTHGIQVILTLKNLVSAMLT